MDGCITFLLAGLSSGLFLSCFANLVALAQRAGSGLGKGPEAFARNQHRRLLLPRVVPPPCGTRILTSCVQGLSHEDMADPGTEALSAQRQRRHFLVSVARWVSPANVLDVGRPK
ncbi:hypothetical protein V8C34DRAFT_283558 [Trichoderma compactum]